MSALLELRGLRVQRGGRQVLEVDALTIQQGQTLAVIGPNGSGKSSLLLTLAGLLRPSAGEIRFHGRPLREYSDLAYRRRLALVLQEPLLLDRPVVDNVALGLRFRGLPRAVVRRRSDEWIARLGLEALRDRRASQLSGGEAQRVSLARAFALQPELLLLDEPFGALDTPTRLHLLDDLQAALALSGTTAVFISHHLDETERLGQRVAILLDGKLRQSGTPREVFNAPADELVRAFVAPPRPNKDPRA